LEGTLKTGNYDTPLMNKVEEAWAVGAAPEAE
jgi:hypothetical protein